MDFGFWTLNAERWKLESKKQRAERQTRDKIQETEESLWPLIWTLYFRLSIDYRAVEVVNWKVEHVIQVPDVIRHTSYVNRE